MKYLFKLTIVLLLVAGVSTCSDYLDPSTPQSKPIESISTVQDLVGIMNGAYSNLSDEPIYGRNYIIWAEVRTANAFSNSSSGRFDRPYQITPPGSDSMDSSIDDGATVWQVGYEVIANANLIIHSDIEGAEQIKGEAYAVRALAHLIILKMYGQQFVDGSDLGIPYVTTFRVAENFNPPRLTVQETYDKIEADFEKALTLLDPTINTSTRMSYYAVLALESRFYLLANNYAAASAAAKEVIESGVYSLVPAAEYVASWEGDGIPGVIFELDMNQTDNRGSNSIFQMLIGESYGDVEVTEELFTLFGDNDIRNGLYATDITGSDKTTERTNFRVLKYDSQYDNTPVIRYAEVILNYAEAEAQLGNTAEALIYLNKIPAHRNASLYTTASLENILVEQRKELAFEGLYYWQRLRRGLDIERTNMRPAVSHNEITVPFGDYRLAFPVPLHEINANGNIQQNQGYGATE